MPDGWYRALCFALTHVYYRRVRLVDACIDASRATTGAVVYVGLHRNGAVDGLIYRRVFPRATFLISSQLTRSRFGRIFFTGIPVTRAQDTGTRDGNAASLDRCVSHLVAGGDLFVLPEGTSDLGPRHLPFKPGVARIVGRALAAGANITVVPVGIFYTAADAFRSDVTVVRGPSVDVTLPEALDARARCDVLMARITCALEGIGINAATSGELARIERMAALASDAPGRAYYVALKALEHNTMPLSVADAWRRIAGAADRRQLATEHGVPVLSRHGVIWNVGWLMLQALLVGAAGGLNAPVVIGAWLAGRRLADARNTIALWRLLVGFPIAVLWLVVVLAALTLVGGTLTTTAYACITLAGLVAYPELRARWPRVRNRRIARSLVAELEIVRPWVRSLVMTNG